MSLDYRDEPWVRKLRAELELMTQVRDTASSMCDNLAAAVTDLQRENTQLRAELERMRMRLEEATGLLDNAETVLECAEPHVQGVSVADDIDDWKQAYGTFLSGAPAREADRELEMQSAACLMPPMPVITPAAPGALSALSKWVKRVESAEATLAAVRAVVDWGQCACCQHLRGVLRTHAPAPGEEGA